MNDMLKRFYEQLEIEQENVRELESECEALNKEKAEMIAEYTVFSALVRERKRRVWRQRVKEQLIFEIILIHYLGRSIALALAKPSRTSFKSSLRLSISFCILS